MSLSCVFIKTICNNNGRINKNDRLNPLASRKPLYHQLEHGMEYLWVILAITNMFRKQVKSRVKLK